MNPKLPLSRRQALKTLFCSSVAMNLNLSSSAAAEESLGGAELDLIALGDFGSGDAKQQAVARAMIHYSEILGKKPDGLLMLGDNFYRKMPGGLESKRWTTGFSEMYPSEHFPNPCWAILGNHDYRDTRDNEKVQLGYAASLDRKTRWSMPGKYYRVDLPARNPQITLLMLDTNLEAVNRPLHGPKIPCWITPEEQTAQKAWLEKQLSSKRAAFTVVLGHHPLYSNGKYQGTPPLIDEIGKLLEKAGVHLYLSGHEHDLQHLELDGLKTSFVISGGGGGRVRGGKEKHPDCFFQDVHGFSHLSIKGGRLHLRHIDVNGKIVHSFSKGTDHDWKIGA
ncbi:metallophosphoesterase [Haloferula chungangensis]|uniref:Metallophosphoesterase n=1 Tax=Haloferula chungangensis TaxID=1048331 RepID=A0ABW2L2Y3_9BACT